MSRRTRILFKTDAESAIHRGAVMYPGHFRPEMAAILWAAGETALSPWNSILVSEGWRPWDEVDRDLHPELRAFDFSLNHIGGTESHRRSLGKAWAKRIRALLGPGYQIEVHGRGRNLHLHIELDP